MRRTLGRPAAVAAAGLLMAAACGSPRQATPATSTAPTPTNATSAAPTPPPAPATRVSGEPRRGVPAFAHIVVVIEENHAADQIIGNPDAPYLGQLAHTGVRLTQSYGITHPSQPNYLALFSGSTQGLTDDSCPHSFAAANLAGQLRAAGRSFVGYAEGLPAPGFAGCSAGNYARRHAPWTNFPALPAAVSQPLRAFPTDYVRLPTVAFVIPDVQHDMHDGTIAQADAWLRAHLGGYVAWARTHDSLLVVTWDEDDFTPRNQIPGVLAGAHLRPGPYAGRVDHYRVLRTIEAAYDLAPLGRAADRTPITGVWLR